MELAERSALEAFVARVRRHSDLTDEEAQAVLDLPARRVIINGAVDIISVRDKVDQVLLVAEGLLCRFDHLTDEQRQITALHIPGDMCNLHSLILPIPGWGVASLQPSVIVKIPHSALRDIASRYVGIAHAFWRDTMVDAAISAMRTAIIGRASARIRAAHLLCELAVRQTSDIRHSRQSFELQLTQDQLGEALCLTSVHVNRTLSDLRRDGLITTGTKRIGIANWEGLVAAARFDPAYLM